jgi:soluble lytic murein transglycosylase-like protein
VYVNAPRSIPARNAAPSVHPSSRLVYWSMKENRWKPVPRPTPSAMQAARSAAAEAVESIASAPANGAVVFDRKPAAAAANPNYRNLVNGHEVSSEDVDATIEQAAARHQVDPNLVRAIVKVESNFNPRAVSRSGAMGLMQLMPDTARRLNVAHPFDPKENVDAGVRHLKSLLNSYGGDVRLSLAAYNAGETAVARHNGVPDYAETRNYVKQITSMYWNGTVPDGPRMLLPRRGSSPIRVFRGSNGVLTITNE